MQRDGSESCVSTRLHGYKAAAAAATRSDCKSITCVTPYRFTQRQWHNGRDATLSPLNPIALISVLDRCFFSPSLYVQVNRSFKANERQRRDAVAAASGGGWKTMIAKAGKSNRRPRKNPTLKRVKRSCFSTFTALTEQIFRFRIYCMRKLLMLHDYGI